MSAAPATAGTVAVTSARRAPSVYQLPFGSGLKFSSETTATYTPLRLALLEDDDILRDRVLVPGLRRHGFDVLALSTIAQLEKILSTTPLDLVVLDIGLPDGSGLAVTRDLQVRHPRLGIVILTGRGSPPEMVQGLSQGADAYLAKPVEIEILAATLFSVVRRLQRSSSPSSASEASAAPALWQLQEDGWCLFSPQGKALALTNSERRVLMCLWNAPGRLVQRETLLATLGGKLGIEIDPHRLDVLLHRLRQKVLQRTGTALPLSSIRGQGYLLMPEAAGD